MSKYSIGVDYGSLSGRVQIVNVDNGDELESHVVEYKHKIMRNSLPNKKTKLPNDWALQHPQDYIDVLTIGIKEVLKKSRISKDNIIGIGVDFTASTVMPISKEGTPLCMLEEYKDRPHSYVKLWQHHAAQEDADKINQLAIEKNEKFIQRYGGNISPEWLLPKAMQILREDPKLYKDMDKFIEAGDWIVLKLTGEHKRNSCAAGYKALWNKNEGYPSKEFLKELSSELEYFVEEKLGKEVCSIGSKAGELTEEMAELIGLNAKTPVGVANIDAHVAVPAAGINKSGEMLMIMGTSTCHMIIDEEEKIIQGISGVIEDGILPGFFGYEAGQACVGDHFDWFIKQGLPKKYLEEAEEKEISQHQLLEEKAIELDIGESGLIALDWWNGNRSILGDSDLTGLILGYQLTTKPEEIYRALIEATAFGTKIIIDTFEENGIKVNKLYATGGIAKKNQLMMQIYSDVCNREIHIIESDQICALGAAMFGAVAAGSENSGYDDIFEASKKMSKSPVKIYKVIQKNNLLYEELYKEYKILHDYFGKSENEVMKRLKKRKVGIKSAKRNS